MKKSVLSIVSAVVSVAWAAEFNASVQGDIASLAYWESLGYSSLPGINDTLRVSGRATSPMYYASSDLSVLNVLFSVSGAYIDLTSAGESVRTITLNSNVNAMEFSADSASYKVLGGKWFFAGSGNVYCGRANTGSLDNHIIEFNSCIVTNVNRFYGAYYDRHTQVDVINGAEIYAANFYPAYGNYVINSKFNISGGSKLVSIDRMIQGDGWDETKPGANEVGGNLIDVSGKGTLLKIGDKSILGHKVPNNELRIRDGAKFESGQVFVGNMYGVDSLISIAGTGTDADTGNIMLGNKEAAYGCGFTVSDGADWYSTGQLSVGVDSRGNYAYFSSATGNCGLVSVGVSAASSNNVLTLDSASKLTLRNGLMFEVGAAGSSNRVEITGGSTVAFSDDGWFVVGKEVSSTGNVLRMAGAGTTVSFPNTDAFDPFGLGCGNSIVLEDGMVLNGGQYNFAFNSSANRFTVRNSTLNSGMHSHIGVGKLDNDGCRGNTLELLDGAAASFLSFSMSAFDNTLFVSNSTFYADDPSRGMRIGYLSSDTLAGCASNNTVWVAGELASVETTGTLSFSNFSRLHFSIPRKGWKTAPVRALKMTCGANTVITADCEEFCNHTGGGIVLVETVNGIDNKRIDAVLATANAKLPPNARFYVSGNNLMFRAPHVKGTVVVVR